LENIILIGVTIFLAYRLYMVLGQHSDTDFMDDSQEESKKGRPETPETPEADDKIIDIAAKRNEAPPPRPASKPTASTVKVNIPGFDEQEFLSNATAAFEMIIKAFTKADKETLKSFLTEEVLADFDKEIKKLKRKKHVLHTEIRQFKSVVLKKASVTKTKVELTVEFVSDQVSVVKDEEHRIIDGDPHTPETITDVWTFRKDPKSEDPTWYLSSTDA